ncbi:MAG TPA: hypothetical protein VMN76_03180, partial [Acidobacteriota bacterium]|nr:hypothetical protein [Acidobacteriota bacterium]
MRTARERTEFDRLADRLLGAESPQLLECVGVPFIPHFRFNPLKHDIGFQTRLLRDSGFDFELVSADGGIYRVGTQPAPLGKSLSHFLGHIYIQDLSSMLPALVLDPKAGDEVLDLC